MSSNAGQGIFLFFVLLLVLVGIGFVVAGIISEGGPQDAAYMNTSSPLNATSGMIYTGMEQAPVGMIAAALLSCAVTLIVILGLLRRH